LWTFQTHYPYFSARGAAASDKRGGGKRKYLAALAEADEQIGRLITALKARGIFDETMLVITSDHGEQFENSGSGRRGLGEDLVRVPLILINPLLVPGSIDRLAGHIDVGPTISDALGIPAPADWDGRSLFRPQPERPVFFGSMWGEPALGYRHRDRKVVQRLTSRQPQVFDLSADPTGSRDIAPTLPSSRLQQERDRLLSWAREVNGRWAG
jgi:arylsulfatase A-like enzyme